MCQPTCLLALSEIKVIFTEMSHQVFCFSIFQGLHQRGDEACTLKSRVGGVGRDVNSCRITSSARRKIKPNSFHLRKR